jgi:mannose-1-phosphate guanylyltransferase
MSQSWSIVLAAGEGSRLRELTTRGGVPTPKQFCSLRGGRTLLGDAIARAARIVPRKRIVVVVAAEHRSFWAQELAGIPAENVIVQPRNRGTAAGILLPLLTVMERDPGARVAVLPSDHFVQMEYVIDAALRLALESLDDFGDGLTLLGITPDAAETAYGWIVPARSQDLLRPIERFVEKPDACLATELFASGGVWNSFLFAAWGANLLAAFAERLPGMLARFRAAFEGGLQGRQERLVALYEQLEQRDFSRDVLQGSEGRLRLEVVPPCGWTDLGTPERVERCVASFRNGLASVESILAPRQGPLDLALAVLSLRDLRGQTPALTA